MRRGRTSEGKPLKLDASKLALDIDVVAGGHGRRKIELDGSDAVVDFINGTRRYAFRT